MNWTEQRYAEHMTRLNAQRETVLSRDEVPDPGPEAQLQSRCMHYCKERGWPCFHDRSKKVNTAGFPDLFIFLPEGRMAFIELKAAGGRLRTEQQELRRTLNWLGHTVHIVRSYKHFLEVVR